MKTIHLYNRDEADLNLVSEDGIRWFFDVDDAHKYILEYMRAGYPPDNEDQYNFIDPVGGPFLRVGGYIDNQHQIEKITYVKNKGFCITTNKTTTE